MDRALLEQLLDQKLSLAEIGRRVGLHEATVSYWVKEHGLQAVGAGTHSAKGALTREQLEPLVEAGLSIGQIAEAVGRGKATVRHWLSRHGLKTQGMTGRRQAAEIQAAREAGAIELSMRCVRHGEARFLLERSGRYRCARCRSEAVSKRRRKVKQVLVEEAGGACRVCGYARCIAALTFHHVVPAEKEFGVASQGFGRSLATVRAEANKCVLLCANCHAEVEAGITVLA